MRLWIMIRGRNSRLDDSLDSYKTIGAGNHHLTVRAIKRTIDGALGSRGAWLLAPYSDEPGTVPEDRILDTEVLDTIVGGEIRYQARR